MLQSRAGTLERSPVATLYQEHAPTILAYLRGRVASREDAEDLLLEVFLAALEHEKLVAFPPNEQLAWLRSVAHHKLVDLYRRAHRRPSVTLEEVEETLEEEEQLPEQVVLHWEEVQNIRDALQRLPPLQQEILRLRFAANLRTSQIAAALGKREGAVRVLLSRAITLLRRFYQE
ncbi:MAG TPA: sigma-70 family RNA polymerase sigma factor [Ktedonobacterales bacterium]|jgi:RNA polymerase sigma-70 factor (ECF subfamily)